MLPDLMTLPSRQAHKKQKRKAKDKGLEDWQLRPLALETTTVG